MTIVTASVSPRARPRPENDRAEQAFLRITQHRDAGRFPPGGAKRVRGFALQIRHAAQKSREETDVMIGRIMMAMMIPPANMHGP